MTTTSTYNAANHDHVGNLTRILDPNSAATTSVWNDTNRRVGVIAPSGDLTTFVYNGDGLRVEKQTPAGTTR